MNKHNGNSVIMKCKYLTMFCHICMVLLGTKRQLQYMNVLINNSSYISKFLIHLISLMVIAVKAYLNTG